VEEPEISCLEHRRASSAESRSSCCGSCRACSRCESRSHDVIVATGALSDLTSIWMLQGHAGAGDGPPAGSSRIRCSFRKSSGSTERTGLGPLWWRSSRRCSRPSRSSSGDSPARARLRELCGELIDRAFSTGRAAHEPLDTPQDRNRAGSSSAQEFTRWPEREIRKPHVRPARSGQPVSSSRGFLTHSNGDSMWTGPGHEGQEDAGDSAHVV